MADKKKTKKKNKKKGSKKAIQMGGKSYGIFVLSILGAIVFMPTTILLLIGMIPTIVAAFTAGAHMRAKTMSVGAMNLAGCSPFLFELWTRGHTIEQSMQIISDIFAMVVIFGAAAVGYGIDKGVTFMMSGILYKNGLSRQKAIEKRKKELVERWGRGVTGDLPLDEDGFIIADQ